MTKFLSPGQNPGAKPVENPFCFSAKYISAKAFKAVKNNRKIVLLIAYLVFLAGNLPASNQQNQLNDYSDHQQMKENLEQLVRDHSDVASLQSLGRTAGDKDILLLTIGTGDTANKPALAVVGGISGDHLLGSELALQFAAKLLAQRQEPAIRHLLDSVVFYIFPDMSPDAREQYFSSLRYARTGNANPTDLDRDGRTGEDGYNDLNNDGWITMMRVKDPTGTWRLHPDDERVMVKARPEKGERGQYLLFSEGIDNDKDGKFNEDGEEGVIFNRNFTFKYPAFERGAGHHAVSETETRAIADFLYQAKNVFAVVSFGPANNLTKPLSYKEKEANARIYTAWKKEDIAINEKISHLYNNYLVEDAPSATPGIDGDFFQWAYFHYGRFSFSTQGWEIPQPESKDNEGYDSEAYHFLRWADENQYEDVFVPWTAVEHPDFPGRLVEVGGIKPFALQNPPYSMVDSIAEKHTAFMIDLAALRPQIDIINLKTEKPGRNLTRITLDVINHGGFPTASASGENVRWMQKTVIRLTPAKDQTLLSGLPVEVMGAIAAHSSEQRSWLIQGTGQVTIKVGSEASGFKEVTVDL